MNKRRLFKNYIYNTLYQILLIAAPLLTAPYVARVLGVTNIAIYQYTQSIATYFVLVGAVGTSLYGQREIAYLQDDPEARSAAFWEIEIFRLVSVLVCTVVYALIFGNFGRYPDIYRILVIEVAAAAFDISWFYTGMEEFRLTVAVNSVVKLIGIACVFIFIKGPDDLWLYTVCLTLPAFLGNICLWIPLGRYLVKTGLDLQGLTAGIRQRLAPILALFLPQIAVDVYTVLDRTMLGLLASDIDQVGYYAQAQRIVKLVLAIVTSLGTVMLPAMSAAYARDDKEAIRESIKKAFRFIYMLAFAMTFGLCAIAPRFVPVFYGDGYEPVAGLMMVISPILILIATSNVIGIQYLLPTKQQKTYTISILIGAGTNFILNLLLIHFWNAIGASIATVAAELAVAAVQCLMVKDQLPVGECLVSGFRYALFGAVMFLACRGAGSLLPDGKVWALIAVIAIGAAVYAAELLVTKDPMLKLGMDVIKRRKTEI